MSNINHSSNALYNLPDRECIIDIVDKIHSIIGHATITDIYSLNGLFSIYLANKIDNVKSIEPDYRTYKILENNVRQYYFPNLHIINDEPIKYINSDTNNIFFDACKYNIYETDHKMKIKIHGIYCEELINIILKKCREVKLFILTTNPKYIAIKPNDMHIYNNIYLLLFHN